MTETITEIHEHTFDSPLHQDDQDAWTATWEGWTINTNHRRIQILIDNSADCCESWGHLVSEDDVTKWVGATVLGVERIEHVEGDDELQAEPAWQSRDVPYGVDEGGAAFVNILTNRGPLQFAVYNSHNGYYGHTAVTILSDADRSAVTL